MVDEIINLLLELVLSLYCRVGRNVAAGMTGGLAYILDEDDTLIPKVCAIKNSSRCGSSFTCQFPKHEQGDNHFYHHDVLCFVHDLLAPSW